MEKKTKKTAVWALLGFVLCASVVSCDTNDAYSNGEGEGNGQTTGLLNCGVISNTFTGSGVVQTRATTGNPDGQLTALSRHQMAFTGNKTRSYVGYNYVKAYDVNRPRYAKSKDIFKNPKITEVPRQNVQVLQTVTFPDGATHDFDITLVETTAYDTDTVIVGGKSFTKCQNLWVDRKLVNSQVTDLGRDSADWHAYRVVLTFRYTLEEGQPNSVDFDVTLPTVWVAKDGKDPDIPDNEREIVSYKDGEKGIQIMNDSIADSWIDIIPVLSNGKDGNPFRKHVYLKYKLSAPEYKIVPVPDLSWTQATAKASEPVKKGDLQQRADSTFVQAYIQAFTTYTSKCDDTFFGEYEGAAYYIDPFGKSHMFLDAQWSFTDNGWKESALTALNGFDRKLLTSNISATYLTKAPTAKGEVELRLLQGGNAQLVTYEYKDFAIRTITPHQKYFTYATQVAVLSDGTKQDVGEIGTTLYVKGDSPEKQTIDVEDFNINDINPSLYNAQKESEREDKQPYGTYKIQKVSQSYVTRTNKSDHPFTFHYENKVVLTDSLGKEITFKGLEVLFADKGSANTLQALPEQDNKERKAITPAITVTVNGTDKADYTAEVEFRKPVDQEELINDPNNDYTQTLTYNGNGIWTSTTTITYVWKIKGTQTETITQNLEWSLSGEAKSQVVLNEASAPYVSLNQGNWSAETSSTPQEFVTLYTKTNTTISEDYTNLTDKYTAKAQRAVINKTVGGKDISIQMLAPTEMTISHKDGSLVDGNRTTVYNSSTYDVWDHTGSVTATVTSSKGNQTETAVDEKEVLVLHPVLPANPNWGYAQTLLAATLTYRPNVGESGQGGFHKTLAIRFENGILIVTTMSYGRDKAWNPIDFTFNEDDFYYFTGKAPNGTAADHIIPETANINSAALFNNRWVPALVTPDGKGWTYATIYNQVVAMSKNLAETCGIKNFTGSATADVTPFLSYVGTLSQDKVLTVTNEKGAPIFYIK